MQEREITGRTPEADVASTNAIPQTSRDLAGPAPSDGPRVHQETPEGAKQMNVYTTRDVRNYRTK